MLEHGGHWREDAQTTMIGMRSEEWARFIHDELGVSEQPDSIVQQVVTGVEQRLWEHVPILPGAQAALERLYGEFHLGLATSAALPVAKTVLERTGWKKFFEAVASADDVAHGKPAPDVYLRALDLLKAGPSRTAAVEDSGNGIRSAHAAGLATIAIPNRAFPPDPGALSLAACILPSLDELDTDTIQAVLQQRLSSSSKGR